MRRKHPTLAAPLLGALLLLPGSGCLAAPAEAVPASADGVAPPTAAAPAFTLTAAEAKRSGSSARLVLRASGPVTAVAKRLSTPPRYYVDLSPCSKPRDLAAPDASALGLPARVGQFSSSPPVVRVVLDLPATGVSPRLVTLGPGSYEIRVDGLPAVGTPAPAVAASATPKPQTDASAKRVTLKLTPRKQPAKTVTPHLRISPPKAMSSRGGATVGVVREEIREAVSLGESAEPPKSLALPEAVPEYLRDAAKVALSRGGHYVWGGQSPEGFDCSGLMCYLYHAAGIRLPRRSSDQAIKGEPIERQDLVAGDLVFFARQGRVFHVGMYLGNGRFFHAANPKRGLTVDALDGPFYGRLYACGRRYIGTGITDYSAGMPTTPDPRDPEASQIGE